MKKLLLLILVGLATLSANSGEDIYKEKYSMSHSNMGKMQENNMKVPPMPMVSLRLKSKLTTKKCEKRNMQSQKQMKCGGSSSSKCGGTVTIPTH